MTEETKNTEIREENRRETEHECFCRKKFKDIIAIAIGSFIGVYCALSLFTAVHRPPCPMGFFGHPGMHYGSMMHHKHMHEKFKNDFFKGDFEKGKFEENKE